MSAHDPPLAGMRVIEVSGFVAAPLGGMTLAQLGADVIRIDPIGGGPDRGRWPVTDSGVSLYWAGLNKGKRSVTVDLRSPEGCAIVADLVAAGAPGGGILLTNARRDGLGYDDLRARRPDVIHVRLDGRHDGGNAVDYTVGAEVGFPYLTGPEGHDGPVNHVLPAWDVATGLYLSVALLAAERRRLLTGRGERIRVALADVALATAGNLGLLTEAQLTADPRPRIGNHMYGEFGRDFATADGGHVMVLVLTTRHWRDLLAATGLAGAAATLEREHGADLTRQADRYAHRDAIAALLEPWFADRTVEQVTAAFAGTSVLWSRYRRLADLVADGGAELRAHPMVGDLDQPGIGRHLAPGSPVAFGDEPRGPLPAPALGGDTEDVLAELLGLSAAEIAGLRERKVVG